MQIHRITLASPDPAAHARFWRGTLGLTVNGRDDSGVEVRLRRTTIAFTLADPGKEPRYHFAINVPRFRLPDAFAWLCERVDPLAFDDGEVVVRFENIDADAVYFLDGGGNVVELVARDTLANDDDRPFGPPLLLEVSEIGLATADVPATGEAVLAALGAPIYWARDYHAAVEKVIDIAGGLLATGPGGADWRSDEIRLYLEKYCESGCGSVWDRGQAGAGIEKRNGPARPARFACKPASAAKR